MSNFFSRFFGRNKKAAIIESSKEVARVLTPERIVDLENLIGCRINDHSYYIQALMHRSFLEHNTEFDVSNERLEFLGDSVLSLVVAEYLFESFPEKNEGFLTKVRAKLVNRSSLADVAERINLADFLLVSKNLSNSFTNGSRTVLSDAIEALIGAVYLDNGLQASKKFIKKILIDPSSKEGEYLIDENFKSQLLEYAQANHLDNPTYSVIKEEGPQHNRIFTIKVSIGHEDFGEGRGRNKKTAEQNAAKAALIKINDDNSQTD